MTTYTKKELAIIEAAAAIISKKGKKESPKKSAEAKPVSLDLRTRIIALIEAEAKKEKGNGYQFSHYLAAKIYYAAKAKGQKIDPAAMSDKTAAILCNAYSIA